MDLFAGIIAFVFVGTFSYLLYHIILKHAQNSYSSSSATGKILRRMILGGIMGMSLSTALLWIYLIAMGRTPGRLNPYIMGLPFIATMVVAWFGFVAGAFVSLFSRKWKK